MKPVGIVSIARAHTPDATCPFTSLMAAVGLNTGNLVFTNAVWEQIAGPKQPVGFTFNPEQANKELRMLAIPAANWLNPRMDFSSLADQIEKLDIPVILIGIGAQGARYSDTPDIPEGTVRLLRAVAERSHSISCRGTFTHGMIARYGIRNAVTTGCPSLYQDFCGQAEHRLLRADTRNAAPLLLHSTRYSAGDKPFARTRSIHRQIFRYAYKTRTDLLLQSETEEISLITPASDKPRLEPGLIKLMMKIYDSGNWQDLKAFIEGHTRVFFDTSKWSAALQKYGHVVGTRLHSTILALNSGVPAILIHHDTRTRELSEFGAIPSIDANGMRLSTDRIARLFKSADFEAYVTTRAQNRKVYTEFLVSNGLEPAAWLTR